MAKTIAPVRQVRNCFDRPKKIEFTGDAWIFSVRNDEVWPRVAVDRDALGDVHLCLRNVDADHSCPEMLGKVFGRRPESTTDVQNPAAISDVGIGGKNLD